MARKTSDKRNTSSPYITMCSDVIYYSICLGITYNLLRGGSTRVPRNPTLINNDTISLAFKTGQNNGNSLISLHWVYSCIINFHFFLPFFHHCVLWSSASSLCVPICGLSTHWTLFPFWKSVSKSAKFRHDSSFLIELLTRIKWEASF